jgi:hypothetical protein
MSESSFTCPGLLASGFSAKTGSRSILTTWPLRVLTFLLNVKYKNIQCTRSGQVVRIDLEPVFALNPLARSPGQVKLDSDMWSSNLVLKVIDRLLINYLLWPGQEYQITGAVGPMFHLPVYLRDLANQRQLKVFSFCSMYNTGLNNQNFNIILT